MQLLPELLPDQHRVAQRKHNCQHHQQGKGQLVGKLHGKTPVLWQYRIILSADTASEVRQMLSQKRR